MVSDCTGLDCCADCIVMEEPAMELVSNAGIHDCVDCLDTRGMLQSQGLNLRRGQSATIILEEKISTGYQWELFEDNPSEAFSASRRSGDMTYDAKVDS